jgi:hypothetical protein
MSTLDASSVATIEALEDRLCFSSPSIGAAVTLSAHQRHLHHVHHVHGVHQDGTVIVIQVGTASLTSSSPLASFGSMALISGAFGTTAPSTFRM